jgi:hypothetical protein
MCSWASTSHRATFHRSSARGSARHTIAMKILRRWSQGYRTMRSRGRRAPTHLRSPVSCCTSWMWRGISPRSLPARTITEQARTAATSSTARREQRCVMRFFDLGARMRAMFASIDDARLEASAPGGGQTLGQSAVGGPRPLRDPSRPGATHAEPLGSCASGRAKNVRALALAI